MKNLYRRIEVVNVVYISDVNVFVLVYYCVFLVNLLGICCVEGFIELLVERDLFLMDLISLFSFLIVFFL